MDDLNRPGGMDDLNRPGEVNLRLDELVLDGQGSIADQLAAAVPWRSAGVPADQVGLISVAVLAAVTEAVPKVPGHMPD
jgi:hypothetical protein